MIAVYEILNTVTGKRYIGSTKNFHQRCKRHRNQLIRNTHHCVYLQRAWNKYGEQCFVFRVISVYEDETSCRKAEQELLDSSYDTLYNTSKLSSGGDLISHHPNKAQIVAHMTTSLNKKYDSMTLEERRVKYGHKGSKNGMYGRKHSIESIAKMRRAKLGKTAHNKGKPMSDAQKAKMSAIAKGRVGEKNPFYGRNHSEEARRKIAEARRGVTPSNARTVFAEGTLYPSATACAKALNVAVGTVCNRIKSKNYENYYYVDEMPND